MGRKELKGLANYCNTHYCEECKFCEECDEIEKKIDTDSVSNCPCYWDDEDIDYILDEINKEEWK